MGLFTAWQMFCALKKWQDPWLRVKQRIQGRGGTVVPFAARGVNSGEMLAGVTIGMPALVPMVALFNIL